MASPGGGDDGRLFEGVRFVLVGFDDDAESQYRSDMVQRGGVDAGRLGNGCTHVIVWGLVYDDSECVVARAQGKKVVTELWVDDSLDHGVLADADRVMYWPVKDLNGIPGAESLQICLTGEKYEAARKVRIKLVNHRWLEDCLKAWKILPVDDYSKSTWELELMEAQEKDSEDEAEDTGQRSFNNRFRVRCTPNMKNRAESSVNADVNPLMRSPIIPNGNREVVVERHSSALGHIREMEDAASKAHDVTAQGSPDPGMLATSAKADGSAPIETPSVLSIKRKNAALRKNSSPNPIQESKEKIVGAKTLDNTSGTPATPNWSTNKLNSSNVDKGQHQEKDGPSGNLVPSVIQSNIDNKLINKDSHPNSGHSSKSSNISNPSNSKKSCQKSLAPERYSVHHTTSHQKAEESMLRPDSSISSLEMGQQNIVERANIKGVKCNEKTRNMDALDDAYAQQRKNLISPTTLKFQKEYLETETIPLSSPFVSRLSDASEIANVSSVGANPAEDVSVDLEKQQSSISTSRRSRASKTSLKHDGPVSGVKLAEYSSCGKNAKSRSKSRTPLKAMTKTKCTTSPSASVQDGKTSSGFSVDNMDGKDAEASASAVNQDLLHLMCERGNAHAKDQAHDISDYGSRNSQVVSCSGFADTTVTAFNGNSNDVLATPKFKLEKMPSDANMKESAKRFRDASSNVQDEASHSKKVANPTEKNGGSKSPRSASMEIDGSVVNTGNKPVSESRPTEVIPHNHADAAPKTGCSTASAAKLKIVSPKKVPISGVRNIVARRTRNALTRMDDSRIAPNLEEISQKDTEMNTKVSDSANADGHKNSLPKKLSNTRVRHTAEKNSQKFVTDMSSEALVDKTEAVAAESLFDDLFLEDNVKGCPKMLSSSASASDCGTLPPKNVSNPRVRNAVAKRKMNDVEHKIDSKCGKLGSAIVSVAKAVSSKRIKEMSCNTVNKINADQDFEEVIKDGVKDVSGSFCQNSATVDKPEGVLNAKLRSSKRNKVLNSDHEKENIKDHSNLDSKANAESGSMCLKSDAQSMQRGTDVSVKCQSVKGNESRALIMSEPIMFILSGYRKQKRDYQSILRHLKGRVCRDSHHWSYQATHFIAPEPLKRTEKFFAAAAAGRWILKSDYLTSCNEASKFLDEGPFEWFGTGLSDGEKISLEAPRKWRILRQQMRHGAFYGMKIIVYGQLILPTLDTVKRAVRAGDGTILATSPPYTRFLDSGVDFAVVSASIPSADAWVQEFIRHGIPCVSADYLVEYVCKPGHPLDSHVLFETNDLANKSLKKLMQNQQEVATDEAEHSEDDDRDDLSCSVCGRNDRGDVMLICGDEDGKVGCGIGMHIDCCDPPLDAIPDDDWFCPKCQVPKTKPKPTRSTGRKLRPAKEM
ncbi:hypothetical protein EJB05_06940 [Eragrostis curvula]|uniref:BRCT domain-containing protein n=1 Tax=Eragrostis curvula TaxID=38414 RepID=A0A5J9WH00_9POAL|nr:hypothetical protein EJB05_06940 [Eragrostis curvula]